MAQAKSPTDQVGAPTIAVDTEKGVNARFQRALNLHQRGDLNEAARLYQQVLKDEPRHFDALHMLGALAMQKQQPAAAIKLLARALKVNPRSASAYSNLAAALNAIRRFKAALDSANRALALSPRFSPAHHNRALALTGLNRNQAALLSFNNALRLEPNNFQTILKRAGLLLTMNQRGKALLAYRRAIALNPAAADAHDGEGNALRWLGRPVEAVDSYNRALALRPNDDRIMVNSAICYLMAGDYDEGFRRYESRLQSQAVQARKPRTVAPQWRGEEDVRGKSVLVWAEQGFGDAFQFFRYVPMLAERGASPVVCVPKEMYSLVAEQEGFGSVITQGMTIPPHHFHVPVLSLPYAFGTRPDTVPAPVPYLRAQPARVRRWQAKLGKKDRPRIGVVWSGNPMFHANEQRSMPLLQIAKLFDLPCQWVSLKKDLSKTDTEALPGLPALLNFSDELQDFSDTAALIESMDLVISTCTSVPHLAAAMGKPVWLMLPFSPDWRWMLEREDSPWYPTVRLFRQPRIGDWDSVLQRVRDALPALLGSGLPPAPTP